jgi:UDP-N-acetylmuramate--alanine ligase
MNIAKKKHLRVIWYSIKRPDSKSTATKLKKIIGIPGEHNLSNAMAISELGKLLKIPEKKVLAAIGSYHGAWRRMEYRGDLSMYRRPAASVKIPVYDDYAHHPTEVAATLQGFHEKFPAVPIVCVFQAHQAKRLKALFKEFITSFRGADILIVIPAYTVAGRDTFHPRFTAERLAGAIAKHYPQKIVRYLPQPRDIKKFLTITLLSSEKCCYSASLVMMGAGDIVRYTDSLLK